MRVLSILKTLSDIVFVLAMIGLLFGLPFIIMVAVVPDQIPFELSGAGNAKTTGAELVTALLVVYCAYAFLVYALHLFRKTLSLFQKRVIFDDTVIKNFDQAGKAILIGSIIGLLPSVYFWAMESPLKLSISFGLNSALITIGLGLFFIVLGEVFLMAKKIKEDNELMI